jgi:hypothetical protein
MSVLHVSIEHSNTVLTHAVKGAENGDNTDENSATAKIYAISSVDGNVIYHVSDSTDQRKIKDRKEERRKITSNPVRAKRIFAVTTLVGGGKRENHYITEKNSYLKEHENALSLNKPQVQNISVFVNPFSSNTTNSSTSNDSATEDDSTHTSNGKVSATHDCVRNVTRFQRSEIGIENGREEKPADILDSYSRKGSNPEFTECDLKFETVNQTHMTGSEECVGGGDLSFSSNMNGGPEVVSGDSSWSLGDEEMLEELEESTTAEEFFGNGNVRSGDSSSINVVEEILHDVLHMVVSQSSEGSQVSNSLQLMYFLEYPHTFLKKKLVTKIWGV